MKHAAVLLAGCLIVGPVPAVSIDGNTITLTDEERESCAEGGGCVVATRGAMVQMLERAKAAGRRECGSNS